MAEYKNQHYVPQHLLRGWAEDERIPVYNLQNKQEYPRTSISNLCSEDYFYGGAEIEESMDGLEDRHAQIITKLRDTRSFEVLDDMEVLHFCSFILLQRNRTKQTKQETDDLIDNLAKEYLKMQAEAGEFDPEMEDGTNILDFLDDFKITKENSLAFPMLQALTSVNLITDLEVALIVNDSESEFIISDHPVVHDNRRFKDEFDRFLVGIQSQGLQIFVPISDEVQIMLYDPDAYFVDYSDKEKRRVSTTSEKVVRGLNDMQMINAFENIFFREGGQEDKFKQTQQRLSEHIKEEPNKFRKLSPEEHDFDTDNEILESGYTAPSYSPYLPFVKRYVDVDFVVERRPNANQKQSEFVNKLLSDAREQFESN